MVARGSDEVEDWLARVASFSEPFATIFGAEAYAIASRQAEEAEGGVREIWLQIAENVRIAE